MQVFLREHPSSTLSNIYNISDIPHSENTTLATFADDTASAGARGRQMGHNISKPLDF